MAEAMRAFKSAGGVKRKDEAKKESQKRKKSSGSGAWCELYNSEVGCPHPVDEDGCIRADGSRKRHGCNFIRDGKPCNSKGHNRPNHH